ncbi:hypothetical protein JI667_17320 [Bacillus sp. NTK074B]|uniref:hypothetical protein n=1 Tax=Bacillus sp. NTK074B TaxID=2802174 RepID=UPI001A8C1BF8|nr:hypothetical protein [Bacillus sp. NTK074B]
MDPFYEDVKKLWMGVEYELNQAIKEKLDDPEYVEYVNQWLQLFHMVVIFFQLLSITDATIKD